MFIFVLAFFAGDLCLQWFYVLPTFFEVGVFALVFLSVTYLTKRIALLAFVAGFVWTFCIAQQHLSWSLPHEQELKPMLVQGTIASIPVKTQFYNRFLFALKNTHAMLTLYAANSVAIHVGDEWQFLVKLKHVHGSQSPGAFDYEAWAIQNGIRATGSIVESSQNKLLDQSIFSYPLQRLREYFHYKLHGKLQNPLLLCLLLGERDEFTQTQWRVLRSTGTNHLFAIAGLHIGIVALFMHTIVSFFWRRNKKLMHYLSAQQAGAIAALFMALIYSSLSGFALPTQRATIMLCLYTYTLLKKTAHNSWSIWSLTILILLFMNPLSVLSESYWLSIGTIALIIYGMSGRMSTSGLWWRWGRVQLVIAIGLIPMSFLFFQQVSIISFIANSIAIPWLTFILPLCLLGFISLFILPNLSDAFFFLADKLMASLWWVLTMLAKLPIAAYFHALPPMLMLFLIPAILILLTMRNFPGKYLAMLWFIPLINAHPPKLAQGKFTLTILDVGQGLSAVIQTANHNLVYDAGPIFSDRLNMGEAVVAPFLHVVGVTQIDKLIISHGDLDHLGGAEFLWENFNIKDINTSVPMKILFAKATYCQAGKKWQWDGVNFEFIYPFKKAKFGSNDTSCVLRVSNEANSVLLPGDIEQQAEKQLLKKTTVLLPSTILIAPHHGSKTSANANFVETIKPKYVIYATGYKNRYHFPHSKVCSAYEELGAQQLNTAYSGTITMEIGEEIVVHEYRKEHQRYWMDS